MDSLWYSLIPLFIFNFIMAITVIVYGCIDKTIPMDKEIQERHASRFLNRWFRSYWVWLISPIEHCFIRLKLNPNTLTTIGFLISVAAGVSYAFGRIGLAGWLIIFGGTFDMFDGRVARATGKTSRSGAYYDAVMDRYGEGIALCGLIYYYRDHWMLAVVLAAFLGSLLVSYNKARAEAMGLRVQGGSMQRPERLVYLGVSSVFSPIFQILLVNYSPFPREQLFLMAALVLIAVATNGSAIARMRESMNALRD